MSSAIKDITQAEGDGPDGDQDQHKRSEHRKPSSVAHVKDAPVEHDEAGLDEAQRKWLHHLYRKLNLIEYQLVSRFWNSFKYIPARRE